MTIVNLKIKLNRDSGEAEVMPIDKQDFLYGESALYQLDVLKDIIHDLTALYNDAMEYLHEDYDDDED